MPASLLTLALLLLLVGGVLCACVVVLLARSLLRPPRMTDGKAMWVLKRLSPGDLGLAFEETAFDVRDAATGNPLRIAGWWIPHPVAAGRCAVLLHGYADAKVGSIARVPTWHALGWNVLAVDLRAHGDSGGTLCTGGYLERHDVGDVLNQIRARLPEQTRRVVLFGTSFGATVAAATAALRDDVHALVLDSPPPDFARGAITHMAGLGAPAGSLGRLAVRLAERMAGADFASVSTLNLIPRLGCPVLVIAPALDPFLEPDAGEAFRTALKTRAPSAGLGVYWRVPEAGHLMALPADPVAYREQLATFLERLEPHTPMASSGLDHTSTPSTMP